MEGRRRKKVQDGSRDSNLFFFRISVFKNRFQAVNTIYTIIMFSSKKQLNDN